MLTLSRAARAGAAAFPIVIFILAAGAASPSYAAEPVTPTLLQTAVEKFSDFLLRYFVALAAVGALAMALIELFKKVRHQETRYHARSVTRWMTDPQRLDRAEQPDMASLASYAQLLHLTTGIALEDAQNAVRTLVARGGVDAGPVWVPSRAEYALFALPLERMMGQIQSAADMALNTPAKYGPLYKFLTSGASDDDVAAWLKSADEMPQGPNVDRRDAKARADLYSRLNQAAKRKLDAFQLFTEQRWVNRNQAAANTVGVLIMFFALWTVWTDHRNLWMIVPLSLIGGMLSPIAKDIVAALRKVRQGV